MKETFPAQAGRIAVSKAGRDKGRYFIVAKCDGVYAYVVDGELRKLERPKKKKYMHLRFKPQVAEDIAKKLNSGTFLSDYDIRQAIAKFNFGS